MKHLFLRRFLWVLLCFLFLAKTAGSQESAEVRVLVRELHEQDEHLGVVGLLDSIYGEQAMPFEMMYLRGRALFHAGRFDQAREVLQEIENDSLFAERSNHLLSNIALQQGRQNDAIRHLLILTKLEPQNPSYWRRIGRIFVGEGKFPAAENYMHKAYMLDSLNQGVIVELADILLKMEAHARAFSLLKKGIRISPDNLAMRRLMVNASYRQKNIQETLGHARWLTQQGDTTNSVIRLKALAYFQLDSLEKSEYWLDYLLDRDVISEDILFNKATVLEARGEIPEALDYYEQAVFSGISSNFSPFIMKQSILLHENQKYPESIRWLQVLKHFSANPLIYFYLARNFDLYYKDRIPALQHYQLFIDRALDNHSQQVAFSQKRISEIRELMHFAGD